MGKVDCSRSIWLDLIFFKTLPPSAPHTGKDCKGHMCAKDPVLPGHLTRTAAGFLTCKSEVRVPRH